MSFLEGHAVLEISVPLTYLCTTVGGGHEEDDEDGGGGEEEHDSYQLSVYKVPYTSWVFCMHYLIII